jgi:hypothetical protein
MAQQQTRRGSPKFVIWAPSFDETNGGSIVLHLLCRRLNEFGETALLWPHDRPAARLGGNPRERLFSTGPFENPIAGPDDLQDAIVVYPEIVSGNPLGGRHVVRWFLHLPGYHTGKTGYGPDELYFYIVDAFNDPTINPHPENRLTLQWENDVYGKTNQGARSGSCYMMRHGAGRPLVHDLADSTPVDAMTHAEKAAEFNRRERFYSYDPYTFYLVYAAICGCIPIVVPEPGKTKDEWQPKPADRYGFAYGEEDIAWAVETRGALLDKLARRRVIEDDMVRRFAARCRDWYLSRCR